VISLKNWDKSEKPKIGICDVCKKRGREEPVPVIKVKDTKTGESEWRCWDHVYNLKPHGGALANRLTQLVGIPKLEEMAKPS